MGFSCRSNVDLPELMISFWCSELWDCRIEENDQMKLCMKGGRGGDMDKVR